MRIFHYDLIKSDKWSLFFSELGLTITARHTHIETEQHSAGWKQARTLYYFIFVCEIRDKLLVFG